MDKKKVTFPKYATVKVTVDGNVIEIKPWLNLGDQAFIINSYLTDMFETPELNIIPVLASDRLRANLIFMANVLDRCTNIDLDGVDFEQDYIEGLFKVVSDNILNFSVLMENLKMAVEDYRAEQVIKNSVGTILDQAYKKLMEVLENFSEMTPEKVESLTASAESLLGELKDLTPPALPVTQVEQPKPKKARRHVKK